MSAFRCESKRVSCIERIMDCIRFIKQVIQENEIHNDIDQMIMEVHDKFLRTEVV